MRRASLALVVLVLATPSAGADVLRRHVEITAPDGAVLKATLYTGAQKAPGILLLHQCSMDRGSWEDLAGRIVEAGVNVMAMDLRGHGESAGAGASREERKRLRKKWPGDVGAAFEFLAGQRDIDADALAVGGASCGVDQALVLAGGKRGVKALVLLSGMIRSGSLETLSAPGAPPVLAAASEEDGRAAEDIRRIVAASPHPRSELLMYRGAGHGVSMFDKEPELEPAIVRWLAATLAKPPEEGEGETR